MSTTTSPQTTTAPPGGFNHWWETRPVRPAGDRTIAGVTSAIAYRYDIDPVIVRIAFVVAALVGGAGFSVYLLCWLLFRYQDNDLRVHDTLYNCRDHGEPLVLPILLTVLLCVSWPSMVSWSDVASLSFAGLALAAAAAYGLYRRCPEPPEHLWWAYGLDHDTDEPPQTAPAFTMSNDQRKAWQRHGGPRPYTRPSAPTDAADRPVPPTPPAWDPMGTAQFAWDLPDPQVTLAAAEREERRRTRRKKDRFITWTTLAVAMIAMTVAGFFVAASTLSTLQLLGIGTAVVAVGLAVSAFNRSGVWLVCAALALGFSMVVTGVANLDRADNPFPDTKIYPDTETTWMPTSPADLEENYAATFSSATLDLSTMEVTEDATARVTVTAAQLLIEPNPDFTLHLKCGDAAASTCTDEIVTAARPDAPTLTLDVDATASEVKVSQNR